MRMSVGVFFASVLLLAAGRAQALQSCSSIADCNDGNDCTDDACVSNACEWTPVVTSTCGPVVDDQLPIKKIKLRIPASNPAANGVRMVHTGGGFTLPGNLPTPLGVDDPVIVGGSLRIFTDAGDVFDHTYALPFEHWDYYPFFSGVDARGYQYRDAYNVESQIGIVNIVSGTVMKLKGKDADNPMPFSLNANPDPVNVVLSLGNHRYCFSTLGWDASNWKPGQIFWAKRTPEPAACP